MRFLRRWLKLFYALLLLNAIDGAQQVTAISQTKDALPSPRSVLGFTPGDARKLADWRSITEYFQRLDTASERVVVKTIGSTTLGRPLIVAFISAPENIKNLAHYQDLQRRLADPRAVNTEAERDALMRDAKAVVAISCSTHADEIVASQMSMKLAYELAGAEDAETREILQNTILLLIPSANPDGIDIVSDWHRKTLGTPAEGTLPPELLHRYAGPEINRDWFALNLKETRHIARLFWREWFPHIIYDLHQQSESNARLTIPTFFNPSMPNILTTLNQEIESFGAQIAADVRQQAETEVNTSTPCRGDDTHAGLRAAAYYHNSVAILSETMSARLMPPSARQAARPVSREATAQAATANDTPRSSLLSTLWRPRDVLELEMKTARSVLALASKNRARQLRSFYELGRANLSAPTYWPRAYLIPAGQGMDEAVAALVGSLVRQGIEVYRMDKELHMAANVSLFHSMSARSMKETPAGSYLVFLSQPYGSLVRALFQTESYSERCGNNGAARQAHNITGGPIPLQLGVNVEAIKVILEPASEQRLTLIQQQTDVHRDLGLPVIDGEAAFSSPVAPGTRLAVYQSAAGSSDEGWTRYLLDAFNVSYKSLREPELAGRNLRQSFDVIILASAQSAQRKRGDGSTVAQLQGGMTEAALESLRGFVRDGGVLICLKAASEMIIERFKLPLRYVLLNSEAARADSDGSIVRINLDAERAIARGAAPQMDVAFVNGEAFELTSEEGARSIARYAETETFRSGLLLDANAIKGRTALAEVGLGQGRVIIFGFSPQHRGQAGAASRLLFNAISSSVNQRR